MQETAKKTRRQHTLQRECRMPERSCTSTLTTGREKSVRFWTSLLSSENRSICWFSGTEIRNRGSEAKTMHSAGSKQDSTRCPSRPHK